MQETNLGYKAGELSLSPEAVFHRNQVTLHRCSRKYETCQNHQQTKVAVSDWLWRRDAVLLTVKGNMQNSIQQTEISPFLRAAGTLGNETHIPNIEDVVLIFICATAVRVLRVDRVVINCRTCVVRVAVVTGRWCALLWARQQWVLVATLGSLDSSLCSVPLRLAQNGCFSCLGKAHACGSLGRLCTVKPNPREQLRTTQHRDRSMLPLKTNAGRGRTLSLAGAMSQAFICWIIQRDSLRLWRRPSAIPHMTVWQRCTSCSVKLPLSYLPWKLRTHKCSDSCTRRADIPSHSIKTHNLLVQFNKELLV